MTPVLGLSERVELRRKRRNLFDQIASINQSIVRDESVLSADRKFCLVLLSSGAPCALIGTLSMVSDVQLGDGVGGLVVSYGWLAFLVGVLTFIYNRRFERKIFAKRAEIWQLETQIAELDRVMHLAGIAD